MAATGSTKSKKKSATPTPTKKQGATTASTPHVLKRWLTTKTSTVGKHPLYLMKERAGVRAAVLDDVRAVVRSHYMSPEVAAQRIADLGAPATAKVLRELLPRTKAARSGDFGEVLAAEVAEQAIGFMVPVRRLRWKDGRNMALRGDDIVGVRVDAKGKLEFLKGESKSYATLKSAVIDEAAEALDRDRGRPGRHAVLFVATRLRDSGNAADASLASQLDAAVVASFSGHSVEHFLLALTGSNPEGFLTRQLTAASKKKRPRHAVGVRISDHGSFIRTLFGGL
jgi:hypothetical protein